MKAIVVSLLLAAFINPAAAQVTPKSQLSQLSQLIAGTRVDITYRRPVARGRELFGALVPWGRVWSPSADTATRITFSTAVQINGSTLPAGAYSIWAIPDSTNWTIIFNRQATAFHMRYPNGQDVMRVKAVPARGGICRDVAVGVPDGRCGFGRAAAPLGNHDGAAEGARPLLSIATQNAPARYACETLTTPRNLAMFRNKCVLTISFAAVLVHSAAGQAATDPAWQDVGRAFQGTPTDGGGYVRYNFPRSDLKVMLGDVQLAPALALVSWAGFSGTPAMSHVMGDIVCTETELPRVLKALADGNFDVTAIHDHLNGEMPRLTYVHYHAMGAAADIGRRLDGVFKMTGAPRPVVAAAKPPPVTIDTAKVFTALGKRGKASGAVASLSFALISEPVMVDGAPVLGALAYGTPISIQQVSPTRAVATGDFSGTLHASCNRSCVRLQPTGSRRPLYTITSSTHRRTCTTRTSGSMVRSTRFWSVSKQRWTQRNSSRGEPDSRAHAGGRWFACEPQAAEVASSTRVRPQCSDARLILRNAHPRTPRQHPHRPGLDPGSRQADADEQPRSRRRREAGRADRLWRTRQGGAQLGCVSRHHRHARPPGERRDAADPERQAGGRAAHARHGAARAARQFQPGAEVGDVGGIRSARQARPDDVRPDDGRVRGSTSARRESCRARTRRSPAPPRSISAARSPERSPSPPGSAAWAARSRSRCRLPAACRICIEIDAARIQRRLETRYLDEVATSLDDAIARAQTRRLRATRTARSACSATPPKCCPQVVARNFTPQLVTDQTSAHDPMWGYIPPAKPDEDINELRAKQPDEYLKRTRAAMVHARRGDPRVAAPRRHRLRLRQQSSRAGAARRPRERVRLSGIRAGVHPRFVLRRTRSVPLGGALRRSRRHRRHRQRHARALSRRRAPAAMARLGRRADRLPGIAGADLLARSRPARQGRTALQRRWCATAQLKAPIVIGRDHLDAGSVASPYRETEAMKDSSDAVSDWPLLNFATGHRQRCGVDVIPSRRRRGHGIFAARGAGRCGRRIGRSGSATGAVPGQRSGDGCHASRRCRDMTRRSRWRASAAWICRRCRRFRPRALRPYRAKIFAPFATHARDRSCHRNRTRYSASGSSPTLFRRTSTHASVWRSDRASASRHSAES